MFWNNKYNFISLQILAIVNTLLHACHICRMNWLEIIGFICGIAGIVLTLKENFWCFPVGLVNVILSMFLFYTQQLYADTLQQLVYIILLFYGWYRWVNGDSNSKRIPITLSSIKLLICCFLVWLGATALLAILLTQYTNASAPWPDSAATSLSFIAQWMVAKKKLENWLLWIAVNILYIAIYLYKDLNLYALLFAIYLGLAIWGYIQWKKEMKAHVIT